MAKWTGDHARERGPRWHKYQELEERELGGHGGPARVRDLRATKGLSDEQLGFDSGNRRYQEPDYEHEVELERRARRWMWDDDDDTEAPW